MLITFKCRPVSDVVMFREHAKPILDLLNKDPARGVITATEALAALATLEAVVAENRSHPASDVVQRDLGAHHGEVHDGINNHAAGAISFSTRAYPLLEMLRAAEKGGYDVLWGI